MNLVRKVRAAEKNQVAKWKTKKSAFSLKDKQCTMQHVFVFGSARVLHGARGVSQVCDCLMFSLRLVQGGCEGALR